MALSLSDDHIEPRAVRFPTIRACVRLSPKRGSEGTIGGLEACFVFVHGGIFRSVKLARCDTHGSVALKT